MCNSYTPEYYSPRVHLYQVFSKSDNKLEGISLQKFLCLLSTNRYSTSQCQPYKLSSSGVSQNSTDLV